MGFLKRLALPGWATLVLPALPYLAFAALVAAYLFQRQQLAATVQQRDRFIHVVDPTGKASPDQAIVIAQRTITERDAAKAALTTTVANYRRATAQAQAADITHARAIEQRDAAITERNQHDLEAQLASARADADDYARRLRARDAASAAAGANQGGSDGAGVPRPADAASGAPVADPATQLADLRACATNTTVAEGWQRWWAEVKATPR